MEVIASSPISHEYLIPFVWLRNGTHQKGCAMAEYPEHEKLAILRDESQAIGEFLDYGLPRLGNGMAIYERTFTDCECRACRKLTRGTMHSEDELATGKYENGRMIEPVKHERWLPTTRSIPSMLAEHFEIDQKALNREKEAMLDEQRKSNARRAAA
jgi:hypothetical protein